MKEKMKKALRMILMICVNCVLLVLLNGALLGVDANYRLPEPEEIARVEVYSSDAERVRIDSATATHESDIKVTWALLSLCCDYKVLPPLNPEDIPRFTAVMTLTDGSEYKVVVGNTTVAFNGTYKNLRKEDAAEVLTNELLGELLK